MIVAYYADSLGLSRPGHVRMEERYIFLFEKWLRGHYAEEIFIINRASAALTIDKLYKMYKDDQEYIKDEQKKDILIIHEGVCDCAPRPVSRRVRMLISALPMFVRTRIITFLHKHRSWLLKNGFANYLVPAGKYRDILKEWLSNAIMQHERIYVITISPTNEAIDKHSPGFQKSITRYNRIIREVVSEIASDKLFIIDIHDMLSKVSEKLNDYIIEEDGHHITALAHRLIADSLIQKETELLKANA